MHIPLKMLFWYLLSPKCCRSCPDLIEPLYDNNIVYSKYPLTIDTWHLWTWHNNNIIYYLYCCYYIVFESARNLDRGLRNSHIPVVGARGRGIAPAQERAHHRPTVRVGIDLKLARRSSKLFRKMCRRRTGSALGSGRPARARSR